MLALLLLMIISSVQSSVVNESNIRENWTEETKRFIAHGFSAYFWEALILNGGLNVLPKLKISQECQLSLEETIYSVRSGKPWALSMVDASAKSEAGFVDGTFGSLGDYDQCLFTAVKTQVGDERILIKGQYCSLKFWNTMQSSTSHLYGDVDRDTTHDPEVVLNRLTRATYSWALCVPSKCSKRDIAAIVNEFTGTSSMWTLAKVGHCTTAFEKTRFQKLTVSQIVSIIVLLTMLTLIVVSTMAEIIWNDETPHVLHSLSAISNFRKLLKRRPEDEKHLLVADRVRVVIALIDISAHPIGNAAAYEAIHINRRSESIAQSLTQYSTQLGTTNAQSEALFFTSAMTASLPILRYLDSKQVVARCISHITRLWIRLVLFLLITDAIQMIMPLLSSGPAFDEEMAKRVEVCTKFRWTRLLMLENLIIPIDNHCNNTQWTLPAEFHLQVLTCIIVIALTYSKLLGTFLIFSTTLVTSLLPPYILYAYDLPTVTVIPTDLRSIKIAVAHLFTKTTVHIPAYLLSFYCIYLRYNGYQLKLNKKHKRLGDWLITIISVFALLLHVPFNVWRWPHNQTAFMIIELIKRPLFYMCSPWALLTSDDLTQVIQHSKHGLKDEKPKEYKHSYLMLIASRLVGPIYFMHVYNIYFDGLTRRQLYNISDYNIFKSILVVLVSSVFSGIAFHLILLAPLDTLLRIVMGTSPPKKTHKE